MEHTTFCADLHKPRYKLLVAVLCCPDAGHSANQLVDGIVPLPNTGQQEAICLSIVPLTSEAKVSMGARVPDVRTTQRAASLTPLKATAGFMDHRHSCTTQVEALLSSSLRLKQ